MSGRKAWRMCEVLDLQDFGRIGQNLKRVSVLKDSHVYMRYIVVACAGQDYAVV